MATSVDRPEGVAEELRVTIRFDPETLRLEHSLIGIVVRLGDCATAGQPGAPALPLRVARIALPPGTRAAGLTVEPRSTVALTDGPVPLAPLQPTRPAASASESVYRRPHEDIWQARPQCRPVEDECRLRPEPFPDPPYVPPDPELYAAAAVEPAARLLRTETPGVTPIASVALRPVRVAADGRLEFSEAFDLTLALEPDRQDSRAETPIVSRAQAMRDIALTRRLVVNPHDVLVYVDRFPFDLFVEAEYLIVTDNQRWNAATQSADEPAGGDIVASFERLAQWKRQRGLKAKVVTICDIVGGRWGDFRSDSRDLQETIRNFLKMARSSWGVAWVLIGGDTGIVPIRYAAGGREGGINRQAMDPPPDNASVWSTDHLRMHVVNPGGWWQAATTNRLVRTDDGRLIPYDSAGTSSSTSAGWFFTTDATYAVRSAAPTQFVRVNGPASLVDGDLQFLYAWNTIPTDLYYSSLVGLSYGVSGRHDWDLLDNGVYGQATASSELDGVNYMPAVSLGRAPVNNAAQADAFVDKLIAYEKFERPDGTPLEDDWPTRAVLVSENWDWNWGGRYRITVTAADPPGPDRYHHAAGDDHSVIRLSTMPNWNWSLISVVSNEDVRLMPYRTDAAAAGRGWYFATSATDLTPSHILISWGGNTAELPRPSSWLAVYGPAEELTPASYIFNSTQLDGSLVDQEELRAQLAAETGLAPPLRLYEDVQDMTPAQLAAGPLEILSSLRLREALDAGPHIVSLSGHGNSNGCCHLSRAMASTLANGFHTFIGYADSCLTSQIDTASMGEALLTNPNGGAVGYMSNTRFSWVGAGDDIQRRFFGEWASLGGNAHLGLLADTRAGFYDDFWWADGRWSVLSLNLFGCPEMPIWWRQPLILRIPPFDLYRRVRFVIEDPNPPDPPFRLDPLYRDEWELTRVHVRQGDREQALTVRGDSVDLPLTGFRPGPATVTVVRAGHRPVVREVRIGGGSSPSVVLVLAMLVLLALALWLALR